jgi:hypothetical protein
MKVLLDTRIIIQSETKKAVDQEIEALYECLDKLQCTKVIHSLTLEELLLNELHSDNADVLISNDQRIHSKAVLAGLSDRVFTIDQFLEKAISENKNLVDYKILGIRKELFSNVDLTNFFFDSFREDYPGFENWFKKKAGEYTYTCYINDQLSAFLYIKIESEFENYGEITPAFSRKKRLKIGTFKVTSNGFKIGERFLKIIFDNALHHRVDEIYATLFNHRSEQIRLITLLENWGFQYYGNKNLDGKQEMVYVKNFDRHQPINLADPKKTFPFSSATSKFFIVPIYPLYHTELFPDSILHSESPLDYLENEPHRNALSKVYISHSRQRNLTAGDLIVFYRTGGIYKGVATTVGIVESMIDNIPDEKTFLRACRKRSVFTDKELIAHWNYRLTNRPFIVNFIYTHSFKKRPNLKWLHENGIIQDIHDMPRGFREISRENFLKIVKYSSSK